MTDKLTQPLSETELVDLAAFLDSDDAPEHTLPLQAVDGFFCSLVVGPQVLSPEEYLPIVWGSEGTPKFKKASDEARVGALLRRHFNEIAATVSDSAAKGKDAYQPLVDEWEGELADDDTPLLDGEWWASGFLLGLELCEEAWFGEEGHDEMLEPLLLPILQLAGHEEVDALEGKARTRLLDQLPGLMLALYRYWRADEDEQAELAEQTAAAVSRTPVRTQPEPGRNDPCPCGSGKKYKHCHGA